MFTSEPRDDAPLAASPPPSIREDKDLIRAAATDLRHAATQDAYRGLQRPEYAYALASVLDIFELRWTDQDGPMREEVRRCCLVLLDRPGDDGDSGTRTG